MQEAGGTNLSTMHLSVLEIRVEKVKGLGGRSLHQSSIQQASSESCSSGSCNGDHLGSEQCPLTSYVFGHTQADCASGSVYFLHYCEISAPRYHRTPSSLKSGLCSNAVSPRGHHGPYRLKQPSCPIATNFPVLHFSGALLIINRLHYISVS